MADTQLLIFRWRGEEYGVPVEDIIGVTGKIWVDMLSIPRYVEEIINIKGKLLPVMDVRAGLKAGDNKLELIMQSNGVQFAIMVDEVVKVTGVHQSNELLPGVAIATFKIWQFENSIESSLA